MWFVGETHLRLLSLWDTGTYTAVSGHFFPWETAQLFEKQLAWDTLCDSDIEHNSMYRAIINRFWS